MPSSEVNTKGIYVGRKSIEFPYDPKNFIFNLCIQTITHGHLEYFRHQKDKKSKQYEIHKRKWCHWLFTVILDGPEKRAANRRVRVTKEDDSGRTLIFLDIYDSEGDVKIAVYRPGSWQNLPGI